MSDEYQDRYFRESIEYPNPAETMLGLGVLHEYVSSQFLAAWVNSIEIDAAWLLTRYSPHSKNVADVDALNKGDHCNTPLDKLVDDDVLILGHVEVRKLTQPCVLCGASEFDPRSDETQRVWWFLWYDRDVSDCAIGRFTTDDSDGEVIRSFAEYARERSLKLSADYSFNQGRHGSLEENAPGQPALKINPSALRRWITF